MTFRAGFTSFIARFSLLLALLLPDCLSAQQNHSIPNPQPLFRNYSLAEGLPSSETYFVLQDRTGYIWFATDRGIVRFDGYRFETFTVENGLTDNVIFRIYEDSKGRVWFISLSNLLSYYKDGKIHAYRGNRSIIEATSAYRLIYKEFYELETGEFIFAHKNLGYLKLNIDGKVDASHYDVSGHKIELTESFGNVYALTTNKNGKSPKDDIVELPVIDMFDSRNSVIGRISSYKDIRTAGNRSRFFLMANHMLYTIAGGKLQNIPFEFPVIAIHYFGNELFVGLGQGGVVRYTVNGDGSLVNRRNYLYGYSVTSVCSDTEGGWWFTTLEQGAFYTPELSFLHWTSTDLKINGITAVEGVKNDIFVKNGVNKVVHLNDPDFYNTPQVSLSQRIMAVFNGKVIVPDYYDPNWQIPRSVASIIAHSRCYTPLKDGIMVYTENAAILKISSRGMIDSLYCFDRRYHAPLYVYSILRTSSGMVFVGTDLGLYRLYESKLLPYHHSDPLYKNAVVDLVEHPVLGIVAATKDHGIYYFRETVNRKRLSSATGLLTNSINSLFLDQENRIWVSSHAGITILQPAGGSIRYFYVTKDNGLPSNEVSKTYVYGNRAWVATKQGVGIVSLSELFSLKPPGIIYPEYIESSSRKFTNLRDVPEFQPNEQYIKIVFGTTNFRSSGHHKFRYRVHRGAQWIYSDVPEIIINNPPADEYEVELSFSYQGSAWSEPVLVSSFSVPLPFYAEWYFIVLMVILALCLVLAAFRIRIRQVKNKHKMITTINDLEQKALSAQMNPHFIFNSLNSIHSFLLYGENEKAEKYLIKFSSLIRKTLANSREKYIRIEDELSILRDYLELEKMRFPGKFSYSLISELDNGGVNCFIPPMLVQPYVENAILHGISSLKEGGEIIVTFRKSENAGLLITIDDNGQGRLKSMNRKKNAHKSFGTTITQERLRFLTLNSGTNFLVETIDKTQNGVSCGTRIELRLPILENYESFESAYN